jgi:hypothetical protein
MIVLMASSAAAESFLPRALAPEHGVDVLSRVEARRLVGRTLLSEPAGSAVYGEVHLYDQFPYVESRWIAVTSDARWQRLLYGEPGEAPRAFGQGGTAAGEFGEPHGMAFAPDGRLFVADRALGRLNVLRLELGANGATLHYVDHIDGLVQPMDVAVHDGGTPADPSDDRVLVAEAGAHRVSLFALDGDRPAKLAEFGSRGSGEQEFLYPRALAVGRRGGASVDEVFVADAGNHRLVRLEMRPGSFAWDAVLDLPMEATSVEADHHGNLLLSMRRDNSIWKVAPDLEQLATLDGELSAPRDVAVPFAWVHDHRGATQSPRWRGEGSAILLESWGENSGVRLVDLGVEIAALQRNGAQELELQLTDAAHTTVAVVDAAGGTRLHDLGELQAGTQTVALPDLAGAHVVTVTAKSLYDPKRSDEAKLELSSVAPRRVTLHQNHPNPFNPTTTIRFDLPLGGHALLDVFDVKGRRVRRVFDGTLQAGTHAVVWDGRDSSGRLAPSGVYFYRLQAQDAKHVRKMVMAQ